MQFTIDAAKDNFSKLIDLARAGEDVEIVGGNTPIAKIVPMPRRKFAIGLLKGKVERGGPDFF